MPVGKKYGGRTKGTPNKTTADVKALAQRYGKQAIERLAKLMTSAESEATQVAAAKELLDRGYGKSKQAVELTGEDGGPIVTQPYRDLTDEELATELAKHGIKP
ncbi:MAG: hypothetical protein FWD62_05275 [Betaproteobacteria bacterium]|nr:hypothetical protein [Betaproteobacteria bacterium]